MFEGKREVPQLFPVLRSLASFHGFRGDFDKGIGYANEILRLADAQGDPNMRIDGLFVLGSYTGFIGQLETGLGYLDEAIEAFESGGYRPRRLRLGVDARVACLTASNFFLWLLGYPDRAVARADRAVAIAAEIDHPYSLAYALYHSGFLHLWRREPDLVNERAIATQRVAEANDLSIWWALSRCLLGAATSALGNPEEGLRQMAEGLDHYQGLRTPPVFWPLIRLMQAGACVDARTSNAGFRLIDEALGLTEADDPMLSLFDVVRGDLSLVAPDPDVAAATASYERAYAVAERFGARMPQLRAATRLCRVATDADRSKRLEALRAVLGTFTEGFATHDLREASVLARAGPDP